MSHQGGCFLRQLKQSGKDLNFWMSEEYIEHAKLVCIDDGQGRTGYQDDSGDWLFPTIDRDGTVNSDGVQLGFIDDEIGPFWDYQYVYDPKNYLDLSGNKWKVLRRHINTMKGREWAYRALQKDDEEEVIQLFLLWSKGRELYDNEVFGRFVLFGKLRWGLFEKGKLRGVNIADSNDDFINYRYCFDDGEKLLNEYLRYRFYVSNYVQNSNKLVNDGGSLDSGSLARFKNKFRPIQIRSVYTGRTNEN